MFIDAFSIQWLDDLHARAAQLAPADRLYVLVDGAFVPGLHKKLASERKAILFALLPGCSEEAGNASPFLTPFDPADKTLKALLQRCDRWPMLSVIATPESLGQLARRLAAWCVIEGDGQVFNFRFPDTRRLPAIVDVLNPIQRAQFLGPATGWTYIGRDGCWHALSVESSSECAADKPVLDERQFAVLAGDSHADELMALLGDRGHEVYSRPSRTHALLSAALGAARKAGMGDHSLIEWCEWFWKQDLLCEEAAVANMLQTWRRTSS